MKRIIKLPPFNGVSVGNTAVLDIPVGNTIHALVLSGSAITPMEMTNIRLQINGKTVQTYANGSDIVRQMEFDGMPNYPTNLTADLSSSNKLMVSFDKPSLLVRDARELTGLGMGLSGVRYTENNPAIIELKARGLYGKTGVKVGDLIDPNPVQTLQLMVTIDAGATGASLECHAVVSEPKPLGFIRNITQHSVTISRGNLYEMDNLPKGAPITRIHFGSQYVNKVDIKRNGYDVLDDVDRDILKFITSSQDKIVYPEAQTNGQSAGYLYALDYEGYGAETLVTHPNSTNELRIKIHSTGSNESHTFPVTVERLATLLSI